MRLEVQILRDMKPRTRPQVINFILSPFEGAKSYRLFPGSAAKDASEVMLLSLIHRGEVFDGWHSVAAQLSIDGALLCSYRPGAFFAYTTDMPSGVIHFPCSAPRDHPVFGGVHTLTLRGAE